MLKEINFLPDGLLDLDASELADALGQPTLIHLPGRAPEPLFVSVLMHGNETVGWDAIRLLLKKHLVADHEEQLPRALSLFIANVDAAKVAMRHLPEQPDYNRIWPGCEQDDRQEDEFAAEKAMMQTVVKRMVDRRVFASIDLHNNTGLNPHYACINRVDDRFLYLAKLFSRTIVYFINPCQVNSMAMARHCPSVTLECGKVGQKLGVQHATDYLEACLKLEAFPAQPIPEQDYDLFHTVATVRIDDAIDFDFANPEVAFNMPGDIEYMNFRALPEGTVFGSLQDNSFMPLDVSGERGEDLTAHYFTVSDGQLRLRREVMPSMLTRDKTVIRQDCLCYLMERYDSGASLES
jgi:succinylglutamate desuccinylase